MKIQMIKWECNMADIDIEFIKSRATLMCVELVRLKDEIARLESDVSHYDSCNMSCGLYGKSDYMGGSYSYSSGAESTMAKESLSRLRVKYYSLLDEKRKLCQSAGLDLFYGEGELNSPKVDERGGM